VEAHDQYPATAGRAGALRSTTSLVDSLQSSQPERHTRRSSSSALTSPMMRTVVSSGNDALNLLFAAAAYDQDNDSQTNNGRETNLQPTVERGTLNAQSSRPTRSTGALGTSPAAPAPAEISDSTQDVIQIWEACRFVKMGWFTAREAITFVDL
jgi:hypothetical protein